MNNSSPRRLSLLSNNRQTISINEQIIFSSFSVTCFGDYILAYLTSSSKNNYLAIWGPEFHLCNSQELFIDSAKVSFLFSFFSFFSYFLLTYFHS